jgi:hypothetical protein
MAVPGRLKFTVRRHKSNDDSLFVELKDWGEETSPVAKGFMAARIDAATAFSTAELQGRTPYICAKSCLSIFLSFYLSIHPSICIYKYVYIYVYTYIHIYIYIYEYDYICI